MTDRMIRANYLREKKLQNKFRESPLSSILWRAKILFRTRPNFWTTRGQITRQTSAGSLGRGKFFANFDDTCVTLSILRIHANLSMQKFCSHVTTRTIRSIRIGRAKENTTGTQAVDNWMTMKIGVRLRWCYHITTSHSTPFLTMRY